ncbi:hypothetical protein JCM10599A_33060 [Paraburkholderia kururiensis]
MAAAFGVLGVLWVCVPAVPQAVSTAEAAASENARRPMDGEEGFNDFSNCGNARPAGSRGVCRGSCNARGAKAVAYRAARTASATGAGAGTS